MFYLYLVSKLYVCSFNHQEKIPLGTPLVTTPPVPILSNLHTGNASQLKFSAEVRKFLQYFSRCY